MLDLEKGSAKSSKSAAFKILHKNRLLVRNFEKKKIVGRFLFETTINIARYQEIIQSYITNLDAKDRFC